jgi:hypothetical protein
LEEVPRQQTNSKDFPPICSSARRAEAAQFEPHNKREHFEKAIWSIAEERMLLPINSSTSCKMVCCMSDKDNCVDATSANKIMLSKA